MEGEPSGEKLGQVGGAEEVDAGAVGQAMAETEGEVLGAGAAGEFAVAEAGTDSQEAGR